LRPTPDNRILKKLRDEKVFESPGKSKKSIEQELKAVDYYGSGNHDHS